MRKIDLEKSREAWIANTLLALGCFDDDCYSEENVEYLKQVWDELVDRFGKDKGSDDTVE